ncbi:MAG: DUF421 domain-containing protein [Eubacterium sp.]|nr:DUF421 domain-containing protein [Eubacterium sp.]
MEILSLIISFLNFSILVFMLLKGDKKQNYSDNKQVALIENSKINIENLKTSNINAEDLMSAARLSGYFNIGDIDTAILEKNGEISFLPKAMRRRLYPKDFNFAPLREGICRIIISQGRINYENLALSGIDETELKKLLEQRGNALDDIFLATANEAGRVDFFTE